MDDRLEKLSTLYRAHITVLKLRHDRALEASGFDKGLNPLEETGVRLLDEAVELRLALNKAK